MAEDFDLLRLAGDLVGHDLQPGFLFVAQAVALVVEKDQAADDDAVAVAGDANPRAFFVEGFDVAGLVGGRRGVPIAGCQRLPPCLTGMVPGANPQLANG